MGCFSLDTLGNAIANPLDPPNPVNPFGSNVHLTDNPVPGPGLGDAGTIGSGSQVGADFQPVGGASTSSSTTSSTDQNSLSGIIGQSLSTILQYQPQLLGAYQQYAPQYFGSNVGALGQQLFGPGFTGNLGDINSGLTGLANQQTTASNTALRTGNQSDIASLGPGALAQLQQLNPGLYASLASQAGAAGQGLSPVSTNGITAPGGNDVLGNLSQRAQGTGIDSLLAQQNQVAGSQLALGGQLTPDQLRSVQQSSRAGFAARGLDATNASVVDEALQTQNAQQQMLQQRLAQAGAVEGQNQQAQGLQNNLGLGASAQQLGYGQLGTAAQQAQGNLTLGTSAQNAALQGQGFNQGQSAFNNYASTLFNPYSTILGQSSQNQGLNQSLFGNASNTAAQSNPGVMSQLNPFSSFAQNYYDTQLSAQTNRDIASTNSNSAITGAGISAAGAIGGAALGACCWVARSVYGTRDNRWQLFRYWLFTRAPRWFFRLYLNHGEKFANFIKDKPRLKARIRIWMDGRLATLPCRYNYSSRPSPASS